MYGLFGTLTIGSVANILLVRLYLRSSACKFPTAVNSLTYCNLSTVKVSDVPTLIGCTILGESLYLASTYVILMFYDGSKSFIFIGETMFTVEATGLLLLMVIQGISACKSYLPSSLTGSLVMVVRASTHNLQLTRVVYRDGEFPPTTNLFYFSWDILISSHRDSILCIYIWCAGL